ncbi:MAG: flagellar basal-body rod protein FlgG [Bdellovibrionales bacterium]|nr:flagellar basal-body rod protein FlgG [Bdellovibrionales bacterium]
MLNALNAAATGMTAQSKQVEVISNNIANADTVSFKKSRAEFQDLLYHTVKDPGAATSATTANPTGVQIGAGVQLAAVSRENGQGSPRGTNRDLDVMIYGNGYFSVQLPNGEIGFTRDGSFQLSQEGRVETSQGYPVVPEIVIPPNAVAVNISADGRVSVSAGSNKEVQEVGQLQVTNFANPGGLISQGNNVFLQSSSSGAAVPGNPGENGSGSLMQKFLESSNVSPVTEMTDLIRAQRVYELNSKVITSTDQMMSTLNQLK